MNILKVEISVLENSVIVSDRSGQKSSSDLNFRQKRCRERRGGRPLNMFKTTKGAHPCTSSSGQGGGKRVLEDFFKNPTTQLRVDWVLTEKKGEKTPKFACFSVQRRPLPLSQAEMLPSHVVLKEGIK